MFALVTVTLDIAGHDEVHDPTDKDSREQEDNNQHLGWIVLTIEVGTQSFCEGKLSITSLIRVGSGIKLS